LKQLWSPWRMKYIQSSKIQGCFFCAALLIADGLENLVVARSPSSFVILNLFPYTSGHLMVVPNQHVAGLELLDAAARADLMELTNQAVQVVQSVYRPQGFNLGINIGEIAGAGVADHIHVHIVPRWGGDTNFMTATADTRVIPEAIEDTYLRLKAAWDKSG
jgi:ATP adenylyltransferase